MEFLDEIEFYFNVFVWERLVKYRGFKSLRMSFWVEEEDCVYELEEWRRLF